MNEVQFTLPYSGIIVCVYFISVLEAWLICLWFKGMNKNVCYMNPEVTSFAASNLCNNSKNKKNHEENIYIFAYIIISVWFRPLVI